MAKRRVCVITGSRAEYGMLSVDRVGAWRRIAAGPDHEPEWALPSFTTIRQKLDAMTDTEKKATA